ncbi:MAG: M23 family metallopeptidase, partial [Methylococcales bacterium]|nr:M23 family metallopeptidase [Methylococcales bacterium]
GRKGGYGRVVIVQHGQKYSSLYAHMSNYKRGQRVGNHVKQGQVIGYVGKSGLATGPHLHYEFRVNGVHRNPLTVKLPHALPIKKSLLAEFKQQTQPLLAQLNKAKASTLLAQNSQ